MADDAGERTEEASEKRREEFRERGEVARSKDAVSVLILFCAITYFTVFGSWLYAELAAFLRHFLDMRELVEMTPQSLVTLISVSTVRMIVIVAPLVAMVVAVSVLGNVAQVGFLFTTKPLEPDLEKLNLITRFIPTFFSKAAVGNLIGSLAKIGMVGLVVWMTIGGEEARIERLTTVPLPGAIRYLLEKSLSMITNVAVMLILIAAFDYAWSRFSLAEKMRMTRQEVKDEAKEYEGNPHLKGAMRRRARDLLNKKMRVAVPTADVIVNNPTHLSVALRYKQGIDAAPIVVAKGADLMALQIRKLAAEHNIPMVENVPLARMLYKHVKVGRTIPSEFYRAVAEVLAYVFKLKALRPAVRRPRPGQAQVRRLDSFERSTRSPLGQ